MVGENVDYEAFKLLDNSSLKELGFKLGDRVKIINSFKDSSSVHANSDSHNNIDNGSRGSTATENEKINKNISNEHESKKHYLLAFYIFTFIQAKYKSIF